jgi:hypothetical protein
MSSFIKQTGLILATVFMFSTVDASSIFNYSTDGKSPGLRDIAFNARNMGVANGLTAFSNYSDLNPYSFAYWSHRQTTQLSVSAKSNINYIYGNNYDDLWTKTLFSQLAINVPLIKRELSLGLGLMPVTNSNIEFVSSGSTKGSTSFEGALSDAFVHVAYRYSPKWSVGMGVLYTFGNLTEENTVDYNIDQYANTNVRHEYRSGAVSAAFNIAYNDSIYALNTYFTVPFTGVSNYSFVSASTDPTVDDKLDFRMPMRISIGAGYRYEKWQLGTTLHYENWESGYEVDGRSFKRDLNDFIYLGLGAEYLPTPKKFASFSEQISYRFGIHVAVLNNKLNSSGVNEYGLHFGLGSPFGTGFGHADIGFELGLRGDKNTHNFDEQYVKVSLSISAGELWFVRKTNR